MPRNKKKREAVDYYEGHFWRKVRDFCIGFIIPIVLGFLLNLFDYAIVVPFLASFICILFIKIKRRWISIGILSFLVALLLLFLCVYFYLLSTVKFDVW